jgi:ketosteroid isomerase-like protein
VDDKVNVQDVVKLTSDGPRIAKSAGSLIIKGKDPVAAGPGASAQPAPAVDATPAIRDIYQKFAEAYQRKDARGMTKYLADQWQGMGGMAAHDFEDELATVFKTFETIQFKVDGLQIQKAAADTFNVSYTANLGVRNSKEKLDEKVNVQDVVKLTADGPRIVKTTGSLIVKSKAPAATGPAAPGQPGQAGQAAQAADATPAIRDIYQKFADAYQRKDARGMAKYLSDQWQGPGGMSAPDFEEGLSASFKTFDSIQFKMEGLQIQKAGPDSFNVSYSASLSGKSSKQNLKVDDRVNIQDVVKITAEGPRIVKTTGSVVMKPK